MAKTVYEIITEEIIKKLELGVAPWRKPWKPGYEAISWKTGNQYRGINTLLTEPGGEYATWKQITEAGGRIKPGEAKNSTMIVYYGEGKEKNNDGDEEKKYRFLKYYRVYNVTTQVEGLELRRDYPDENAESNLERIEAAEKLVADFMDKPDIVYKSGGAVYNSNFDRVTVPPLSDYEVAEEYYCTLFHELVHSTGHEDRLNRKFGKRFADVPYSKEELVAEIGAAMLCGVAGIEQKIIDNSVAYLDSWIKVLKKDSKLIVTASSEAQKAADYIQNIKKSSVKAAG
ncbi:zincin-like metallopeptidase domain-containing protein [Paenibacillus alvei]|uniref:Zincin-like metallopeptidase domain-containing protein n=1 Tax=Paenibacillus alvei TaxID=44250 RepID=A0ABT4H3L0_PAEAL|nr:zincin-like metallopeptidase domain-containing protein [Paenibacillus alvei]MCY9763519.1 zincin-like metallopeptidase domain-containing protein [Paenibacillus alvei]MCY9765294.1 zincin-like metallopeptidase domain-containing protein [Paenibacillus alvei]NEZ44404.1 DUF1738 domain-containing protein [Paenibacillus alvei]